MADAALYVKETIVEMNALGQLFITRVPQKLKEAKTLIQNASLLTFEPICDGYQGVWHISDYGDIEQKWLLVRSEQATKREHYTLNSRMLKQAGVARPSKNHASKRLPVAQMPLQPLSNGRKNKPRWQSKPQCLKCQFTKAKDEYFPDMKKKPTQTPTVRWVFQCFAGIDLLTINEQQTLLLNIKDRQSVIIKILGINYQRIYS